MNLNDARLIVLDLDDTLYLERDYVLSGIQSVAGVVEQYHGSCKFREVAQRRFEEGQRRNLFDDTLRQLGIAYDQRLIQKLVYIYRRHLPHIQLLPDASRFLSYWSNRCELAIITDGHLLAQQSKVRALKLALQVQQVIFTDQWGKPFWKPHWRAFRLAEANFQVESGQCVYIGDNPRKDFLAPNQLGWQTIRIQRPGGLHAQEHVQGPYQPAATIQSLDELVRVRRRLAA